MFFSWVCWAHYLTTTILTLLLLPQIAMTVPLLLLLFVLLLPFNSVLFFSFTHFLIIFLPHFPIASYQIKWDVLRRTLVMCWVGQQCVYVCVCGCICPCDCLYVSVHTADMCVFLCVLILSVSVCVKHTCKGCPRAPTESDEMSFYQHFLTEELSEYWCMAVLHWGALVVCIQRAGKRLWRLISACVRSLCVFLMETAWMSGCVWSNLSPCI